MGGKDEVRGGGEWNSSGDGCDYAIRGWGNEGGLVAVKGRRGRLWSPIREREDTGEEGYC